jgi:hypothetical protein
MELHTRTKAQSLCARSRDFERRSSNICAIGSSSHRRELDVKWQIWIHRVHSGARGRMCEKKRAGSNKRPYLKDACRFRGSRETAQIMDIRRGERPLRHGSAWIPKRLIHREDLFKSLRATRIECVFGLQLDRCCTLR